MTVPKPRKTTVKHAPLKTTQATSPVVAPTPVAPPDRASPVQTTNGKKKKKKKGKGKGVAVELEYGDYEDDDIPPLEPVNGIYEAEMQVQGRPRTGSRTGLSPELESVHLSTTASLSGKLNPAASVADADLLAAADHLARSMEVDPEGGVSNEYWETFPDQLRNFVRHTYSQLGSAGDDERKTQAMYAIAQQIQAGGGVNLQVPVGATVKGATRGAVHGVGAAIATAAARYGPPGAYPTSMPFDPSIFTDPDFTLAMEQAAAANRLHVGVGVGMGGEMGLPATANMVVYEQDYPEDEYFSEDEVDEMDDDPPGAVLHTTEAQFTLRADEHEAYLEHAHIEQYTTEDHRRKKNKKKKKKTYVNEYPGEYPGEYLGEEGEEAPEEMPDPAAVPGGERPEVTAAPAATNLVSAPHNRMPAPRPPPAANPPPSSRAAGKQPMSYTAPAPANPPPPSRRAASKAPITSHAYPHNHAHHHPSPPSSNASAPQKHRPPANGTAEPPQPKNNKIWSTSTTEERERIKEFWLGLGEEERRNLVKIEKEAVLRKMKEQQKHSCMCAVCGRKRNAIEEELEVLYDAYYEELEQYANYQQRYISSGGTIPPPQGPGPFPGSVELDKNGAVIGPHTVTTPRAKHGVNGRKAIKQAESEFDEDDPDEEEYEEEEEYEDDEEEDEEEDEDEEPEGEEDEELKPPPERRTAPRRRAVNGKNARDGVINFGNNLTVTGAGNILTVADDLLKNDGQKFLEMMEQLAERRMQREEEAADDVAEDSEEDEEDEGDEEDEDEEDDEDEDDEEEVMTEQEKMEEGKRMFSIFAARMFEQRVLQAYREKVAQARQLQLLRELEDEDKVSKEREAKKQTQNQKKKDKKRQQKQAKEEEKAVKAAEKAAEDAAVKAKQAAQEEESRKRKEEDRARREALRKAQEEEKQRKEEERRKRIAEEKEREAERERKRREKEEKARLERREREERERKAKEEKEAKLAAERAAKREQQEREDRERRLAKEKDEKDKVEREKAEKEKLEKERLEKEKTEKEARERQLAQQRATAVRAPRPPTSPRNATASGSTPRSPNPAPTLKKAASKTPVLPQVPVLQPIRQMSQPRPSVITSPQPPPMPQPMTPHMQHIQQPGTPIFPSPMQPVMSPRVAYSPSGHFPPNYGPGPSMGPPLQMPPALAPSAVPRGAFGPGAPFDAFGRNLAPPTPIGPPSKAMPQQNPLASPTQLAPGSRRLSMADPGPITRPVAPIAPIARPAGEASGSGSTSPSRRSPSPKGVLGSSALAADDDEIVTAPGRRSVAPGAVGWGPATASPRSNGPDMRVPWGSSPAFSSPRPPLWNPSAAPEWHTPPAFFGNHFTNHNPSPPPHTGS